MASWQVQEAKARLSELIEKARTEGPQTITKHGSEAAVVLSMDEYRRLSKHGSEDFVDWLLNAPKWPEGFELPERQVDAPREVDLGDK